MFFKKMSAHSIQPFPIEVIMKNPQSSLLVLVAACLLALFGCSPSDSDNSSGGSSLTGPIADLQGTYITGCYAAGSEYAKEIFTLSGTTVSSRADYYSDASCTTLDNRISGTFTNVVIGDSVTFTDGTSGRKISYAVQTYEITVFSTTTAAGYNSASLCGLTTWTTDTPVDLLGKTCSGTVIDVKNTTQYNLYNLMGNNLYLGTPKTDVYPTTVNTNVMYVKQ